MNWDAIGAIGEITGAIAVVATLAVLIHQVRQSTKATQESNRLERAAALERHSDSIGRWRGRMTESDELSRIWLKASNDETLTEVETYRLSNLFIEFMNVQRSNFVRASIIGEEGLAHQACVSLAAQIRDSSTFRKLWEGGKPWMSLANPDYVESVDAEIKKMDDDPDSVYHPVPLMNTLID